MRFGVLAIPLLVFGMLAPGVHASYTHSQEARIPQTVVTAREHDAQNETEAVTCQSCADRKQRLKRLRPADTTPPASG